jgi:hypothetical protein
MDILEYHRKEIILIHNMQLKVMDLLILWIIANDNIAATAIMTWIKMMYD